MPRWKSVPGEHWDFASEMRKAPTRGEQLLWSRLRRDQLGSSFRRQHPIGPFIVDFCCRAHRLIIEVDGDTHGNEEQIAYDSRRDEYLISKGYRVLRYSDKDVISNLDSVVNDIFGQFPP